MQSMQSFGSQCLIESPPTSSFQVILEHLWFFHIVRKCWFWMMGQFHENIITRSTIFFLVYLDLWTIIFACDRNKNRLNLGKRELLGKYYGFHLSMSFFNYRLEFSTSLETWLPMAPKTHSSQDFKT